MVASTAPDSTDCPTVTSMLATVPSSGATTGVSIFITSNTRIASPRFTASPTFLSMLNTFPAAPASIFTFPAPPAAGAEAAGAAGAGAAARLGAAGAAAPVPFSSTVTS